MARQSAVVAQGMPRAERRARHRAARAAASRVVHAVEVTSEAQTAATSGEVGVAVAVEVADVRERRAEEGERAVEREGPGRGDIDGDAAAEGRSDGEVG